MKVLESWSKLRKAELIALLYQDNEKQRLERLTQAKADKKARSKANRAAKREEAQRRAEAKQAETNQRIQRRENAVGVRPSGKETKSQRKQRKQAERRYDQAEAQRVVQERAQKGNPKKERQQRKRAHRAAKKAARRQANTPALTEPTLRSTAINGKTKKWFVSGEGYKDPRVFLTAAKPSVQKVVDSEEGSKKVHLNLVCTLVKENMVSKQVDTDTFGARSKTHTVTVQLGDTYDEMTEKMLESLAKFQKNGSGWRLKSIEGLEVFLTKFEPLRGAGYSALPPFIASQEKSCHQHEKQGRPML